LKGRAARPEEASQIRGAFARRPDLLAIKREWQPVGQLWPILATAALGVITAISTWLAVSAWEERLTKARFTNVAGDYAAVLQTGLDEYLGKILAVRAFYDASNQVDAEEFNLFTSQILPGFDHAMRIVWAPRVTRENRVQFEADLRARGLPDFSIKIWSLSSPMPPSLEHDDYFPILYSTVSSNRSATLGTDLNSEPRRSEAIRRARDGNMMATAQGIQLRNPIEGLRDGFLAVIPVYRHGTPLNSLDERRRNTLGVLVGGFQIKALFDAILADASLPQNVDLSLYPADAGPDALPVYLRGEASRERPLQAMPQKALVELPAWTTVLKAGDAKWNLVVAPGEAGFVNFYRAWLVVLAVVIVFAVVLIYMWASLRHALRLEAANSRILELAQTDLLTNLANRRAFVKRLTASFSAASRGGPPFAVLYLDIDNFKDVNDTLGHAMGDLLLKEIVIGCGTPCAAKTWSRASAATNSPFSCPTSPIRRRPRSLPPGSADCWRLPSASRATRSASPRVSASQRIRRRLPVPTP
jgi:CHASE1-domain containing sensor protein